MSRALLMHDRVKRPFHHKLPARRVEADEPGAAPAAAWRSAGGANNSQTAALLSQVRGDVTIGGIWGN